VTVEAIAAGWAGGPPAHAGIAVRCQNVVHIYTTVAGHDVVALRGVNLDIAPGEQVALLGPSGSGKSTLLGLFGGLQRASAGQVIVDGVDISRIPEAELTALRAGKVASLLQGARRNLLTYATAAGNVEFARRGMGGGRRPAPAPGAPAPRDARARRAGRHPRQCHVRRRAATGGAGSDGLQWRRLATGRRTDLAARARRPRHHGRADPAGERRARHDRGHRHPRPGHRGPHPSPGHHPQRPIGSEGLHGHDYAVIDQDGAVHLPEDWAEDYPPGSLVEFEETENGFFVRRVDVAPGDRA
jgi:energy-coupling factor transporter ATP-binding protein EcfA2